MLFQFFTPLAGGENQSYGGRVIVVTWGDYTRRIGIDGSADAIKEAIKSAFRLRTKRAFWLEDEDQIVRSLDRDMPLGSYTLHLDEGICFVLTMIIVRYLLSSSKIITSFCKFSSKLLLFAVIDMMRTLKVPRQIPHYLG